MLWGDNSVIVEDPVDLGTNVPQLILPRETREELRSMETNRAPPADELSYSPRTSTNSTAAATIGAARAVLIG